MKPDKRVNEILRDAALERPITRAEAELLLSLPEDSLEAALLRATADAISRRRFGNNALLLGQIGVDLPCVQHGAMQRFPVPGSPLYSKGQVSVTRLGQIVAVIVLATAGKKELKSIAVNVSNLIGLFSGANAFFPEAGEPAAEPAPCDSQNARDGFTTALWRQCREITTADCRSMLLEAGFSDLMDTRGNPTNRLPQRHP